MKSFASDRLEQTLGFWKDIHWFQEMLINASFPGSILPSDHPSPVTRWRSIDQTVFDQTVKRLNPSDWCLPWGLKSVPGVAPLRLFPIEFFEWSRKSRRIYHLPERLCQVFGMATYPEIRWKDVLFPFDSFIITLEQPIVVEEREGIWANYDTILVTKMPGESFIHLRMFGAPYVSKEKWRFPRQHKEKAERLLKQEKHEKLGRTLMKNWRSWMIPMQYSPGWRCGPLVNFNLVTAESRVRLEVADLVTETDNNQLQSLELNDAAAEVRWRLEPTSWAAKIVVGWCLYLRRLAVSRTSWSEQENRRLVPRGSKGVTGVITQVDHICTVLGEAKMDLAYYGAREPREQSSGFFKRPHWRRSHDRRLPSGELREMPPMLIREDLVPYFGIIGGTKTHVLDDD